MTTRERLISHKELTDRLNYDPTTGIFTWKQDGYNRVVKAGDVAGFDKCNGYWQLCLNKVKYNAHRVAWFYVHGEWPENDIDHINGNRGDNRIDNLRSVTRSVNLQNLRGPRKIGTSGYLGVTQKGSRFLAQIGANGKHYGLGRFDTAEQAHQAYLAAKRKLHAGCTI